MQESKQEVTKVIPLVKMAEKLPGHSKLIVTRLLIGTKKVYI